ncbi:MAG: glycosyltransferase family 2 protein [Oscillospiraceae bacterium]|nr:glycosyltransferase family 2 protein [Oscillospiraceae bacterium]
MAKWTVDVVIPTYKPDEKFDRLMQMLQKQTYPIGTILIMNTEKRFFPKKGYETWQKVQLRHIKAEDFDHGGTRDGAASLLSGDLILFMTQDAVPTDEYLVERLAAAFADEQVAAAYARQLPDLNCDWIERYTRSFNYPEKSRLKTAEDIPELGIKAFFASNVCAAYRRELFWKQGGFPERTIFNEDMIFAGWAVKAGYGIAYAAEARVIHSHNLSGREQFHRNFDLAVSQTEHPEVFAGIRSEGEGLRLVKSTVKYLLKCGKFYLIPGMMWTTGCKYLGYLLGKRYKRLPKRFVRACSLNKRYWGDK